MKISGFTYVKNGLNYGCPFMESILSILPICDEMVIAVGNSTDGTKEAIESLNNNKIKIIDTSWDLNSRKNGHVFAQQANIAIDHLSGDWAFHVQADEVIHEKDLAIIKEAIIKYDNNQQVDGFILPFLHFWGDYWHIRNSRRVHRQEVRIFRTNLSIRSYLDSQGFRKYSSLDSYEKGLEKGKKLNVKKINAPVYHYNGVRTPAKMNTKWANFNFYYGFSEDQSEKNLPDFDFNAVDRVATFSGTHPATMNELIQSHSIKFTPDKSKATWRLKDRLIQPIEDILGFRIGEYKNYKLLK